MAQFIGQGRLKLRPLNSDGGGVQCKLVDNGLFFVGGFRSSFEVQKRKFKFLDSKTTPLFTSPSSCSSKRSRHLYVASLDVDDQVVDSSFEEGFERGFFKIGADELASFKGLVLDVSYRPINVVCWKRAICLEFMEKADVLEYYDQSVNSPGGSFYIPAVLRVSNLLQVVKRRIINNNLNRKNLLYRDNYTCQYCSSRENLTIDHILPVSQGGEWKWENLVTACARCNSRKGQKTVEAADMKLIKVPKAPKDYDIVAIPLTSAALRMLKLGKGAPEEWRQYLSN